MLCSCSLEILNNFIRAMEHTPGTYSLGLLTVLAPPYHHIPAPPAITTRGLGGEGRVGVRHTCPQEGLSGGMSSPGWQNHDVFSRLCLLPVQIPSMSWHNGTVHLRATHLLWVCGKEIPGSVFLIPARAWCIGPATGGRGYPGADGLSGRAGSLGT